MRPHRKSLSRFNKLLLIGEPFQLDIRMAASSSTSTPPKKFGVVLFPGFQALDVFGPLDILNLLSKYTPQLELYILSRTLDPVPTKAYVKGFEMSQSVVPTHTFDNAPDDIEVLLVPGGFGTRQPDLVESAVDFVKSAFPKLRYLLTVCTGSALVAMTGLLDGKRATSNKRAFSWVSLPSFWVLQAELWGF